MPVKWIQEGTQGHNTVPLPSQHERKIDERLYLIVVVTFIFPVLVKGRGSNYTIP
jgi:hypothetical protein